MAPLTDPVLLAATVRVQSFYAQSFWANPDGHRMCMAALALAKRGLNVDNVFFLWGPGGVGLSLTTIGTRNHKIFDPQVFYMDEASSPECGTERVWYQGVELGTADRMEKYVRHFCNRQYSNS